MTQELKVSSSVAVADQISFITALLGGVAATTLRTVVILSSAKRAHALLVATSALSAYSLLISAIAGWRLILGRRLNAVEADNGSQ